MQPTCVLCGDAVLKECPYCGSGFCRACWYVVTAYLPEYGYCLRCEHVDRRYIQDSQATLQYRKPMTNVPQARLDGYC